MQPPCLLSGTCQESGGDRLQAALPTASLALQPNACGLGPMLGTAEFFLVFKPGAKDVVLTQTKFLEREREERLPLGAPEGPTLLLPPSVRNQHLTGASSQPAALGRGASHVTKWDQLSPRCCGWPTEPLHGTPLFIWTLGASYLLVLIPAACTPAGARASKPCGLLGMGGWDSGGQERCDSCLHTQDAAEAVNWK